MPRLFQLFTTLAMREDSTLEDRFFDAETLRERHQLSDSIKCYESICRSVSERLRGSDSPRLPGRIVPDSLSRIAEIYREQHNLERSVAFLELSNLFAKQLLAPDDPTTNLPALFDRLDAELSVDDSRAQRQTRLVVDALSRLAEASANRRLAAAPGNNLSRWCEANPAVLAIAGLAILLVVSGLLIARVSGAQHRHTAAAAARDAQRKKAHSEWQRRRIEKRREEEPDRQKIESVRPSLAEQSDQLGVG
jgi:hypothetical protein